MHRSQFRINVLAGIAAMVISTIAQLVLTPIYLEELGRELYGLWATISILLVVGYISDQGLADSLTRHIAQAHEQDDHDAATEYAVTAMVIALIIGSVMAAIAALFTDVIIASLQQLPQQYVSIAKQLIITLGLTIIPMLLATVVSASIIGFGRMDLRCYVQIVARICQVIVAVVCIYQGYGVWGVYLGFLCFYLVCGLLGTVLCATAGSIAIWRLNRFRIDRLKEIVSMGHKLVTSRVVALCFDPMMRWAIAAHIGLEFVTVFDVAYRIVSQIRALITTGFKALIPRVSVEELSGIEGLNKTWQLNRKLMMILAAFSLAVMGITLVAGDPLLALWLRDAYDPRIYYATLILLAGFLINTVVVPLWYTLIGWGRTDLVLIQTVLTAALTVIGLGGSWLLNFPYEVYGVTAAFSGAIGVGAICMLPLFYVAYRTQVSRVSDQSITQTAP